MLFLVLPTSESSAYSLGLYSPSEGTYIVTEPVLLECVHDWCLVTESRGERWHHPSWVLPPVLPCEVPVLICLSRLPEEYYRKL